MTGNVERVGNNKSLSTNGYLWTIRLAINFNQIGHLHRRRQHL